jgi:hypothetical protein
MSMMMPPEAPPGMPLPPGGGGDVPPMDAMSSTPMPAEGGIEGLIAALQGGGMGGPPGMGGGLEGLGLPGGAPPEEALGSDEALTAVDHIKQAMKHLMMAMAGEDDDERGAGIVSGMGALQKLLGGEQKRQKILADAGG